MLFKKLNLHNFSPTAKSRNTQATNQRAELHTEQLFNYLPNCSGSQQSIAEFVIAQSMIDQIQNLE
jgi:hypothetical protein